MFSQQSEGHDIFERIFCAHVDFLAMAYTSNTPISFHGQLSRWWLLHAAKEDLSGYCISSSSKKLEKRPWQLLIK